MKKHLFKAFALIALAVVGLGQQMRAMPIPVPQYPDDATFAEIPLTPGATESRLWDVYQIEDANWHGDLWVFGGREYFPNDNTPTKHRPLVGFVWRPRNAVGNLIRDPQGHVYTFKFTYNPTGASVTNIEGEVLTVTVDEMMGQFLTQAGGWCRSGTATATGFGEPCLWAAWNGFPSFHYAVPMPFTGVTSGRVTCMTNIANTMSGGAHMAGFINGYPFESHFSGGPQIWTSTFANGQSGGLEHGGVYAMSSSGQTLFGYNQVVSTAGGDGAFWANGSNAQISFQGGGFFAANDAGTHGLGYQITQNGRETVLHQSSGVTILTSLTWGQATGIYGGRGAITSDNDLWVTSEVNGFPAPPRVDDWQASTAYRFKWNGTGYDTEVSASNYLGAFPSIGTLAANFDSVLGQDSSPFGVTICGSVGNVGNRRGVIAYVPAALRY